MWTGAVAALMFTSPKSLDRPVAAAVAAVVAEVRQAYGCDHGRRVAPGVQPEDLARLEYTPAARFADRHGVAVDVRSRAYVNLWLRSPDPRLPLPEIRHWYRRPGCQPGYQIGEPGLWLPLSCAITIAGGGAAHVTVFGLTGGTSGAIDTSGASLLVGFYSYNTGGARTISDSKSNTWVGLTARDNGTDAAHRIYYVVNPTVGSGHTFTAAGGTLAQTLGVIAFAGVQTSPDPFDVQNGNQGLSAGSVAVGAVTPSVDNELVVAGLALPDVRTPTIDVGFTIVDHVAFGAGDHYGMDSAWLVQTTAALVAPTWSWSGGNTNFAAGDATFKAAAGGGGRASKNIRAFPLGMALGMHIGEPGVCSRRPDLRYAA